MDQNDIYNFSANALCGLGAFLFYYNWLTNRGNFIWVHITPWLTLLMAGSLWNRAIGIEFAIVYTLLSASLYIWILIAFHSIYSRAQRGLKREPTKENNKSRGQPIQKSAISPLLKIITVIIVGPLAGAFSLLLCLTLMPLLPFSEPSRLVSAAFMFVFIWALAAVWGLASTLKQRPALIMIMTSLTCFLLIRV